MRVAAIRTASASAAIHSALGLRKNMNGSGRADFAAS
jgi:hypothetical protein